MALVSGMVIGVDFNSNQKIPERRKAEESKPLRLSAPNGDQFIVVPSLIWSIIRPIDRAGARTSGG
jgi:hypothetical protein